MFNTETGKSLLKALQNAFTKLHVVLQGVEDRHQLLDEFRKQSLCSPFVRLKLERTANADPIGDQPDKPHGALKLPSTDAVHSPFRAYGAPQTGQSATLYDHETELRQARVFWTQYLRIPLVGPSPGESPKTMLIHSLLDALCNTTQSTPKLDASTRTAVGFP